MKDINEKSILTIDLDWIVENYQTNLVFNLIIKKLKKSKKIIFIKSHHLLLRYIEDENSIYNLDHHHDLGYKESDDPKLIEQKIYREGNWLLHLIHNKIINKYVWICNSDSDIKSPHLNEIRNLEYYYHTTDINILNNIEFDKIVICESFEYVKSSNFFELIKSLCLTLFKEKTIVDDTKNISSFIKITLD
jgi:hypothetical protein